MRILLVEPDYYTTYPPLGLLKLAKMEEGKFNEVRLVRGTIPVSDFIPDKIYITSLFTFSWKPVHAAIEYYHAQFPDAEVNVGGIYATLMPRNIKEAFPYARMHMGLVPEAENVLPAYHLLKTVDKWKDWNKSIVFTSRGCLRKCPFCVVPRVEGGMQAQKYSILPLLNPEYSEVTIWDNNFLASPYAKVILEELRDNGYKADFNQGLDARLMTEEFAGLLADIKPKTIHMAYDWPFEGPYVKKAIGMMGEAGYRTKDLIFYVLHNFYDDMHKKGDTPADFFRRISDLMSWKASAYPMRYIPLDSLTRRGYVSPLWTEEQLEMVAKARRIMGHMGTFLYYPELADKFVNASNFEEALYVPPVHKAGTVISKKGGEHHESIAVYQTKLC